MMLDVSHYFSRARHAIGRLRTAITPTPLPGAATINLASPEIARDPFAHYERLRRAGSVQFLAHHGVWLVLSHADVLSAFAQPALFSNSGYADVDSVLLGADPPDHTAIRRVISSHFAPAAIDHLCAFAEARAATLLTPQLDIVDGYGRPLSVAVTAELLGLDAGAVADIHAAQATAARLSDYLSALDRIADRAVMFASLRDEGLPDADARSLVRLLWLAGTVTTERVIAHGVLTLLTRDDLRRAITEDAARLPALVEEVLRLHPPELMVPRVTTAAVTIGGVDVPAGARVYLCVAAANRDPAVFTDAATLRMDRPAARHFTFGFGIHHCIGATLGRRLITIAIRTLFTHAPDVRAVAPRGDIRYCNSMTANAIEHLAVATGERRAGLPASPHGDHD